MAVRDDFVERFTIIKETYSLTYPELSKIFGIKGKSTVNEWIRARKSFPNEAVLALISDIFAVSLDWLLGRIDKPYNEMILTSLEEKYAVSLLAMAIGTPITPLPEIYTNIDLRRKNYTQGQRANLIFAALSSYYRASNITNETRFQRLLKDYIAKIEGIDSLLYRDLNKPIWDLESVIAAKRECVDIDLSSII